MKSLDSAMRVLTSLMEEQQNFGVSELAGRLGLPKSQVSKVLATLRRHGLVQQDPVTRRYSVGLRAYALGSRFITYDRLSRESLPIIRSLVEETGHSARLSVRDGDEAIYLIGVEGPHFIDTGWHAGTWLPWHATSAGRILLAFMEEEEVERIIAAKGMAPVTSYSVSSHSRLKTVLARARKRGYDVQRNETTIGLGTIAVPIFGEQQRVVGALSLVFPETVVDAGEEPELASILHGRARVLSMRMGSVVYPVGQG
ncbi:IclR family transcriptional regulator [Chelativorans sp. Marseille-P2723]|uniref:IclR family transcriptional regulator n=1 Tax=Chelativorans sp. Marseille-P2723 TaxID=2709133 RepID=UPI00156E906D|nr:IclR family transcriptional regulator [Chelativorans sp. Marseille-P2723]